MRNKPGALGSLPARADTHFLFLPLSRQQFNGDGSAVDDRHADARAGEQSHAEEGRTVHRQHDARPQLPMPQHGTCEHIKLRRAAVAQPGINETLIGKAQFGDLRQRQGEKPRKARVDNRIEGFLLSLGALQHEGNGRVLSGDYVARDHE